VLEITVSLFLPPREAKTTRVASGVGFSCACMEKHSAAPGELLGEQGVAEANHDIPDHAKTLNIDPYSL
jgi:hypothetical protein